MQLFPDAGSRHVLRPSPPDRRDPIAQLHHVQSRHQKSGVYGPEQERRQQDKEGTGTDT